MHEDVQPAPLRPDAIEYGLQLTGNRDIQRTGDRGLELLRKRLDVGSRPFVEPGDGEFRTDGSECPGATVGDGLVIRHANDKRLLAGENRPYIFLAHNGVP